jgi:4-diphosphocytidyl-2-C-methyl-D-erythritol kinase
MGDNQLKNNEPTIVASYAKLNLLLNVQSKSFNGYHSLESIIVPLELCDYLHIEMIDKDRNPVITTNDKSVPSDEKNILYKCISLFKEHFDIPYNFKIDLLKNIPTRSGLGGESANAASMIYFLNKEFELNLSYSDIFYYGRLLSWDVPICYFQKYMYINDKKSVCEEIICTKEYYILLVMPEYGISTSEAFKLYDSQDYCINKDGSILLEALLQNQNNIGNHIHNCFICTNKKLQKDYDSLLQYCHTLGFDGISMTGTGSCFYLVTSDDEILRKGFNKLKNKYPFVYATKTKLFLQETKISNYNLPFF